MAQTITGELYDVYREMGGTEKSRPTIAGMIDLIQRQIGSGGGGAFAVTVTEDSGTYTADKTLAEILAAIAAGQEVYADVEVEENSYRCRLTSYYNSGDAEADYVQLAAIEPFIEDNVLEEIVSVSFYMDGSGLSVKKGQADFSAAEG